MSSYRAAGSEPQITRDLRETQRRVRGGELGGMTTPVDPLQPLFNPASLYFGCISGCFLYRPPPAPRDFKTKATRPKTTPHTRFVPTLCVRCRFYGFFGSSKGGRGLMEGLGVE